MSTRSTRRAKGAARNQNSTKNDKTVAPADVQQSVLQNADAREIIASENAVTKNVEAQNVGAQNADAKNVETKVAPQSVTPKNVGENASSRATSVSRQSEKRGAEKRGKNAREKPQSSTRLATANTTEIAPQALWQDGVSPRTWKWLFWSVLFIAAVLRLWNLDLVPFHHDEGVNGDFTKTLFNKGEYKYNPENFHGPTLYFFALVTSYFNTFLLGKEGFNDLPLRFVPVCFGIGVIALVLGLRRHLGTIATLCAALLLAISPGMVYISRYFIHEMQFVFFTLLAVVAALRLKPRGAWWWPALVALLVAGSLSSHAALNWAGERGVPPLTMTMLQFFILSWGLGGALTQSRPAGNWNWALVGAASLALLFGSKETAPISLIVLLFAGALTWLLCDVLRRDKTSSSTRIQADDEEDETISLFHDRRIVLLALGALIVFWGITAAFFSSFDRSYYQEGMAKFFAAYDVWRKTGESDFQAKPLLTYLVWILTIEPAIFVLGFGGAMLALWQRRSRFSVFCALWALGLFAAYSLIPYKTPWLMLNFVLPFCLTAGFLIQQIVAFIAPRFQESSTRLSERSWSFPNWKKAYAMAAPAVLLTLVQMWYLNFKDYDNDDAVRRAPTRENPQGEVIQLPKWQITKYDKVTRSDKKVDLLPGDIKKYPYIYVHTQRGFKDFLAKIDELGTLSGLGYKMPVMVTSPEYWPMPWSLRNYGVGYYGKVQAPTNEAVVVGRTDANKDYNQDDELQRLIGDRYVRTGTYDLRPSVTLTLWVRRDLALQMKAADDAKADANND